MRKSVEWKNCCWNLFIAPQNFRTVSKLKFLYSSTTNIRKQNFFNFFTSFLQYVQNRPSIPGATGDNQA